MASAQHLQQQKYALENRIRTLVNDDLKSICRAYGYQVSGTKIVLQKRCLEVLNDTIKAGGGPALDTLRYRIEHRGHDPLTGGIGIGLDYHTQSGYNNYNMAPQRSGGGVPANQLPSNGKWFKSSPFYEIQETLVNIHDLPGPSEMPQNRHTVRASLTIKPHIAEQLRKEPQYRILLYCGEYQSISPYSQAHVSFPNQIELKVNDMEVKSNFKGLKNKPGSTKPADITSSIKKFHGHPNTIHLTYALTTKRFVFVVYLVRHITPEKLTDRIKRHSVIRKQKVLDAMSQANADPDIAATSIRMSLKDPISTMRITVPIRSSHCTHNQCFDGAMFTQLQEQAPQWSCPVCSKNIPFESLCVDEYFQEILDRTPITTEKVDIEPNGQWKVIKDEDDDDEEQADGTSNKRARASYDDDFEDLVEIDQPDSKKEKANGIRRESFQPLPSPIGGAPIALNTPPITSREVSVAGSTGRAASKRPQSGVIDLTLSDDEDEQPPRSAKRHQTTRRNFGNHSSSYNTPNSMPDSRYQPEARAPTQPSQQQISFQSTINHGRNRLSNSALNAPSMSPPYQPSPPMHHQSAWSPTAALSNYQRHSTTPSYGNNSSNTNMNGGMYPPPASPTAQRSPLTLRPPPPPGNRDDYYGSNAGYNSGYNSGYTSANASNYSPRPAQAQAQHGGLRLPPLNAASSPGQSGYGGGWRSDYDYGGGNWPQSPNG